MSEIKQDNVIVFDFLKHLKKAKLEEQYLSEIEKNMLNILELSLSARKIAYFKESDSDNCIYLKFQKGYDFARINYLKDLIAQGVSEDFSTGISICEKGGLKNTYLRQIKGGTDRYSFFLELPQPLSGPKHDIAENAIKTVSLINDSIIEKGFDKLTNQFNELVLQNIASGIIVIDNNDNIVFLNKTAEMIIGYRFHDLKDTNCGRIFREIDGDKNWLSFTLRTGALSSRKKIFMVRKDGIEVAVGGTTSLLRNDDGEIIGVIGIFREYEDFQNQENRKKDLNKISTLAKLSASIAHEIRNPLAGISATAQVLATKMDGDDRKMRFVNVILEEIDRINRIIKELLNFASPSKTSFFKSNVNKIMESSIDLVHKRIQRQNVEVSRDYDRELPDISCDENQIKQAVVNVMLNSVNAMPDGGLLSVKTGKLNKDSSDWIKIVIQDSGCGIPKEVLNDLFSPFTSTKTQGLGLGLTITRSIINSHNGIIEAENLPDKGARFTILIPIEEREPLEDQTYLPLNEIDTLK